MMLSAWGYRPAPWMEPFWVSERLKTTPHSLSRKARMTKPKAIATSAIMEATKRRGWFLLGGGGGAGGNRRGQGGEEARRPLIVRRCDWASATTPRTRGARRGGAASC